MSKKCLVIDDVEVSRYVIGEILQDFGFSVVQAAAKTYCYLARVRVQLGHRQFQFRCVGLMQWEST